MVEEAGRFMAGGPRRARCLVLVVIPVVVMMLVSAIAAAASYFFELLATLARLLALFSVALHRIPQPFFRLVSIAFTSAVVRSAVVRARRQRRSNQTDHRQQGNTENSDSSSHFASPLDLIRSAW